MSKELREHLADKEWRVNNLYKIVNKKKELVTFKRNQAQTHFNEHKAKRNIILKSRQLGFCLHPNTRVLTADLKWVKIKDIEPNTEIVAVDEQTGTRGIGRKMKTAIVEKVVKVNRIAFRITLDDGRKLICTGQHPWLTRKKGSDCKWRAIENRDGLQGRIKIGTHIRWITKPWDNEHNYEDGWFGGILDGEGSISKRNVSSGISTCQRAGDVWNRMVEYAEDNNYNYRIEVDKRKPNKDKPSKLGTKDVYKIQFGRMDEQFRLLGITRPSRFLNSRFWEGRQLPGKKTGIGWSKVAKIEELGKRNMIDLQTSSGTYIAEGFVSHNTTDESIDGIDDVLWNENFKALFLSYDKDSATEIFDDKIKMAWDNYDFKLKAAYNIDTDSKNKLKFGFGNNSSSSIIVRNRGRSGTFNRVHISEFGKICKESPGKAKEIIAGTIPAVPLNGRVDIESTAEGEEGHFYNMFWDAWNRGEPTTDLEFKSHFYNWTWDIDEIETLKLIYVADMLCMRKFLKIQKDNEFSDREISYYYQKWLSLNKDWKILKQEYPITPEEAFETSGVKFFDRDKLKEQKTRVGVPVGDWIYYNDYIPGHIYAGGCDVAEGVEQDSSTIVIMDFSLLRPEVVAIYKSNKIEPDTFAYEVKAGGTRYGNCLMAVERNNHGHTTLATLKGIYFNIFEEIKYDKFSDKHTNKLGWHTNLASKPKMLSELKTAVNDEIINLISKELIAECITYDKEDINVVRFDAEKTRHWDLLIGLAICFQMKEYAFDNNIIEEDDEEVLDPFTLM